MTSNVIRERALAFREARRLECEARREREAALREVRRLERECWRLRETVRSIERGEFEFPDAETKARALAVWKGRLLKAIGAVLHASPDILELPDGRFVHKEVAERLQR